MRSKEAFVAACLPLLIAVGLRAQTAVTPAESDRFELVWADEFNVDGPPNPDNWAYERGLVRNEELQWYQPENARCEGGHLIIEARRERVKNPRYNPEGRGWQRHREFAEFTSACLITRGKHEWKYGRFEMRGRIDTRPGLWPAWWTLGSARAWPGGGEIDIMEYYDGVLLANVAWLGPRRWTAQWDESRRPIKEFPDADWSRKFHVWQMDWDAQRIELRVDGQVLNTTDLQETINQDREAANPFHEPHYMLLNLAIGGTRGGDPSGTEFPARFEVDYVRVYRK
jgi:beta-glucanase (GH16 family)